MGVAEEAGHVATSAVEAMRGSPSCLAAILLAALFALLTYASLQRAEERNHERMLQVSALLQACYPAHAEPIYPPRANRRAPDDP